MRLTHIDLPIESTTKTLEFKHIYNTQDLPAISMANATISISTLETSTSDVRLKLILTANISHPYYTGLDSAFTTYRSAIVSKVKTKFFLSDLLEPTGAFSVSLEKHTLTISLDTYVSKFKDKELAKDLIFTTNDTIEQITKSIDSFTPYSPTEILKALTTLNDTYFAPILDAVSHLLTAYNDIRDTLTKEYDKSS